jgi:hypothetical protein
VLREALQLLNFGNLDYCESIAETPAGRGFCNSVVQCGASLLALPPMEYWHAVRHTALVPLKQKKKLLDPPSSPLHLG